MRKPILWIVIKEGSSQPAKLQRLPIILKILACAAIMLYGPCRDKTCLRVFANNTGADQPAHLGSLISAFLIHVLKVHI